jgi:hypothetical protein
VTHDRNLLGVVFMSTPMESGPGMARTIFGSTGYLEKL